MLRVFCLNLLEDGEDCELILEPSSPQSLTLHLPASSTLGMLKQQVVARLPARVGDGRHDQAGLRCVFGKFVSPLAVVEGVGAVRVLSPLQDLREDSKTLEQYGITQDVWLILKKKIIPVAQLTSPGLAAAAESLPSSGQKRSLNSHKAADDHDNQTISTAADPDGRANSTAGRNDRALSTAAGAGGLSNEDFRRLFALPARQQPPQPPAT
eukprot:g51550.t1